MSETPVTPIKETPVLRPADFRTDAYFFYPQNRDYLSGFNTQRGLKVSNNPYSYLVLAILEGIIVGGIVFSCPFMGQGGIPLVMVPVLLVLAFLIPYVLFVSNKDQLTERAVQKGQILIGTLEACRATIRNDSYQINIVYLFTTPAGKLIRRHTTQTRPDLNGKPLPALNRPIYVLYFNDDDYFLL